MKILDLTHDMTEPGISALCDTLKAAADVHIQLYKTKPRKIEAKLRAARHDLLRILLNPKTETSA